MRLRLIGDEVKRMDRDLARGDLDLLALAQEVAGALAADLDGGVCRGRLADATREACEDMLDGFLRGHHEVRDLLRDFPRIVAAVRRKAEGQLCAVRLVGELEVFDEPGGLPYRNRQDACRGGVERTGMADALHAEHLAHGADDVVRGHAGRLEDVEESVHHFAPWQW